MPPACGTSWTTTAANTETDQQFGPCHNDFLADPTRDQIDGVGIKRQHDRHRARDRSSGDLANRRSTDTWSSRRTTAPGRGMERGDRDGAGVVRVVLGRPARAERSHPRRQHRRHIDHVLTGSDELLGEQMAAPLAARWPTAVPRTIRPPATASGTGGTGADLERCEFSFADIDGGGDAEVAAAGRTPARNAAGPSDLESHAIARHVSSETGTPTWLGDVS